MRSRNFYVPMNFLAPPELYTKLKETADEEGTTMSKILRDGAVLRLDEIAQKNREKKAREDIDSDSSDDESDEE